MKLITLGIAVALAAGSVGIAYATPTNMVTNGDFSSTSPGQTAPTQFGPNSGSCGIGSQTWGGQFVSGWTANDHYSVWYPSAAAASGTQACTQYGNTTHQYLPTTVTGAPSGTATFVGLDGDPAVGYSAISQTIGGLTAGDKYTVSFWWASTQELSRTGPTTEQFQVSLGTQSFKTGINSIDTHGWSGWAHESFTFTAGSGTGSDILNFLSIGTPSSLPPFALLSDVSLVHAVPEPPELAMFGAGLLGLGLLTVLARRRAQRRNGVGDIA